MHWVRWWISKFCIYRVHNRRRRKLTESSGFPADAYPANKMRAAAAEDFMVVVVRMIWFFVAKFCEKGHTGWSTLFFLSWDSRSYVCFDENSWSERKDFLVLNKASNSKIQAFPVWCLKTGHVKRTMRDKVSLKNAPKIENSHTYALLQQERLWEKRDFQNHFPIICITCCWPLPCGKRKCYRLSSSLFRKRQTSNYVVIKEFRFCNSLSWDNSWDDCLPSKSGCHVGKPNNIVLGAYSFTHQRNLANVGSQRGGRKSTSWSGLLRGRDCSQQTRTAKGGTKSTSRYGGQRRCNVPNGLGLCGNCLQLFCASQHGWRWYRRACGNHHQLFLGNDAKEA